MIIILKVFSILFSCVSFIGYAWFDREYLSLIEKIFMLSSAFGLLIIGVIPFRFLRLRSFRVIFTVILLTGIVRTVFGIFEALTTTGAADTNGATLHLVVLIILCMGVYFSWRIEPEEPMGSEK